MNIGDVTLRRRVAWIICNAEISPELSTLDAGCGDGLYSGLFNPAEYIGFDHDVEMIRRAKAVNPQHTFFVGDVEDIYSPILLDRVICTEVLEHVPSPMFALMNLRRVLKPNGIALITVPDNYYPFWFDPTRRWSRHGGFAPYEIKTLCENAGFIVEKCELLTQHVFPFYYHLVHAGAVIHHKIPIPGTNRYGKPPSWVNPLRWAQWMIDAVDARNDYNPEWQTNVPSVNIGLKLRPR